MSGIEKINAPENPQFTHILSHATKVPGLIFLSGSTPVDKDGKVVEGGIKVDSNYHLSSETVLIKIVLENQGAHSTYIIYSSVQPNVANTG